MRKFEWNDEWIFEHLDSFSRWSDMCKEYNEVFGTDYTRQQFKWHTNQSLGLRLPDYRYSAEHDKWLKDNYMKFTHRELGEKFNEHFGTKKTWNGLKEHCRLLGLLVDAEEKTRRARLGQEYATSCKRLPVGTIGRPSNGYLLIKKEDGTWEFLTKHILRSKGIECEPGYQTVFLDGDKTNYNPNNLDVMPIKYAPIMMQNKFFSEQPEITKTGIKWCELYESLKKEGEKYIADYE